MMVDWPNISMKKKNGDDKGGGGNNIANCVRNYCPSLKWEVLSNNKEK